MSDFDFKKPFLILGTHNQREENGGVFSCPSDSLFTPEGTILVSHCTKGNNKITEFNLNGEIKRQVVFENMDSSVKMVIVEENLLLVTENHCDKDDKMMLLNRGTLECFKTLQHKLHPFSTTKGAYYREATKEILVYDYGIGVIIIFDNLLEQKRVLEPEIIEDKRPGAFAVNSAGEVYLYYPVINQIRKLDMETGKTTETHFKVDAMELLDNIYFDTEDNLFLVSVGFFVPVKILSRDSGKQLKAFGILGSGFARSIHFNRLDESMMLTDSKRHVVYWFGKRNNVI